MAHWVIHSVTRPLLQKLHPHRCSVKRGTTTTARRLERLPNRPRVSPFSSRQRIFPVNIHLSRSLAPFTASLGDCAACL
jgi:hypothetical protein